MLKRKSYLLQRGNQVLSEEKTKEILGLSFPWLFPFGHGGPWEERDIIISEDELYKHLQRLSHKTFAEDFYFSMVVFDMISRKKGRVAGMLMGTRDDSYFESCT